MNGIVKCLNRLTETRGVMEALRSNLRRLEPAYSEEENSFYRAVESLKGTLSADSCTCLEQLISAEEERIGTCLIYLFGQGLKQNESCFRDPVEKRFLELDFEEICQENVLNSLPQALRGQEAWKTVWGLFGEEQKRRFGTITSYYCYLETVGYKLAHYWGFRWGDMILGKMIPGYVSDNGLTVAYRQMIRTYLEFEPE